MWKPNLLDEYFLFKGNKGNLPLVLWCSCEQTEKQTWFTLQALLDAV